MHHQNRNIQSKAKLKQHIAACGASTFPKQRDTLQTKGSVPCRPKAVCLANLRQCALQTKAVCLADFRRVALHTEGSAHSRHSRLEG
mmetsp:Transcript_15176/g.41093  ORF Transcript_15176/g.41093 Transcript_15176/m.41093 type:complete len:87 (+) Transcript_15176:1419-1679(+)